MRKNSLVVMMNILCFTVFSQINIRENIITEPIDNRKVTEYDSILDFTTQERNIDYLKYIGQELYLPPLADKNSTGIEYYDMNSVLTLRSKNEMELPFDTIKNNLEVLKMYYFNYNTSIQKTYLYNAYYRPIINGGREPNLGLSKSTFNKNYKIINITDTENKDLRHLSTKLNEVRVWLETEGNDTIYFNKDVTYGYKSLYPFILKGYLEHTQKKMVDKKLILFKEYDSNQNNGLGYIDINTGETIIPEIGDIWKCDDISFIKNKNEVYKELLVPFFILSKDNNFIKVRLGELVESGFISLENWNILYNIWLSERENQNKLIKADNDKLYKDCLKQFSGDICNKLIKGKIDLGMSKKMVLFSLGSPFKSYMLKSKFGVREMFSYGGTLIYFLDNKVDAIEEYK